MKGGLIRSTMRRHPANCKIKFTKLRIFTFLFENILRI